MSSAKNPTTFRTPKTTERKRFVIWLWTRGPYMTPRWYKRTTCDSLESAKARLSFMKANHPEEIEDGWVITVETITVRHETVEEEGVLS